MRKITCIFFMTLVLLITAVPVFAADTVLDEKDSLQPMYTHILLLEAGLAVNSSGKATCSGMVQPSSLDYDCYLTVELQKKSGSSWSTIATWTEQDLNGYGAELEEYKYVTQGTYRVKSTGVVKNPVNSTSETGTKYSSEVSYN